MVDNNTTQTYLALRFAMLMLPLMLGVAIVAQWMLVDSFCFLHSISAYHHSAVRSVFVGVLCAIGVCLIAYRGNIDKENVALDCSGFMAFIVAFVPTEYDAACTLADGPPPDAAQLADAAANNVLAVLVIGLVAALAAWRWQSLRPDPDGQHSRFAKGALTATLILLVAGFLIFFLERDLFLRYGHATAAILLFTGIIAVVWFNAADFAAKRGGNPRRNRYAVMTVVMTLTVAGCVVLYVLGIPYAVLVVEALLITEFAVFWGMQTAELRSNDVRPVASQVVSSGDGRR